MPSPCGHPESDRYERERGDSECRTCRRLRYRDWLLETRPDGLTNREYRTLYEAERMKRSLEQ